MKENLKSKDLSNMSYKQLWRYSLKLKEGSKAWDRVMDRMLYIKDRIRRFYL